LNRKLKTKFCQVVSFTSDAHFLRGKKAALPASPPKVALSNRKLERWKNFHWPFFGRPHLMVKEFFPSKKPFFELWVIFEIVLEDRFPPSR
jgi:hypothetical protein